MNHVSTKFDVTKGRLHGCTHSTLASPAKDLQSWTDAIVHPSGFQVHFHVDPISEVEVRRDRSNPVMIFLPQKKKVKKKHRGVQNKGNLKFKMITVKTKELHKLISKKT